MQTWRNVTLFVCKFRDYEAHLEKDHSHLPLWTLAQRFIFPSGPKWLIFTLGSETRVSRFA
jgi:hypothetical protein